MSLIETCAKFGHGLQYLPSGKKLFKLGSYIQQTMPRKHDNIFPQRKSILFSCNDWIPTMTTTISSMWSAKVNLQFPTKKFTALKESHDFAFGVRSLSTHRIPVFFGGYEHSTQKRIQQQQQHVNNNMSTTTPTTPTTTTTTVATAATHVLIIPFLSLSTQQVWNATTECDERMQ